MDIFNERLKKISARNKSKKKHEVGQVWPIEKKVEVVTQWLVMGNLKQVSALTGVTYDLIRKWRGQPWWAELEAEIRSSQNIEMDVKLSEIVEKSLAATLDRIENGDFIYDQKSGEIRRKPAALKDVHKVAVDMLGQRENLRKGADDRNEGVQVSVEEHLKMLATQMAQWFEPKKQKLKQLEEVEDAIYEERETGLQEGTGVGEEDPSDPSEGPSGTEQSPSGTGQNGSGA